MSNRRRRLVREKRPLRVGFVTLSLGRGGAERWILTLCKSFSKWIDVTGIITWDLQGDLAQEARTLTRLFHPHETEEFFSGCDVVIAWGVMLSEVRGIKEFKGKIVACSHGSSVQPFHRKTNADMASIPGCVLTAVSDAAALSFPAGRDVTVIPNGVELERCSPRLGRRNTRGLLGIPEDAKVALFFARIAAEKRPLLLADAVLNMEGWYAVFAGIDYEGIGEKLPKHERVIHLEPQENPGDLLSAADCFVLPSNTEAHPLALTEAWVAGVPTVYCDWGFADQIRGTYGEDFGEVIPVEFSQWELEEAIQRSQSGKHTHKARDTAWKDFTSTAMAARWEHFLGVPTPDFRRVCKPPPTVG